MKIYLMTDLEGVAGVVNFNDYCSPESRYYENARRLLTLEVNAAVSGLFEGGADAVTVFDGHGPGGINIELLDERTCYNRGHYTPIWPWGLDEGYDAVVIIGQHAKSGTPFSHLTHTSNFDVYEESVNGIAIGEYGQLVLCARELGIPTILATGEKAFTLEAQQITPGVITVAVKRGLTPDDGSKYKTAEEYENSKLSAEHLAPARARKLIREAAVKAATLLKENPAQFKYIDINPPYTIKTIYRALNRTNGVMSEKMATHPTSYIAALNQFYGSKPAPAKNKA